MELAAFFAQGVDPVGAALLEDGGKVVDFDIQVEEGRAVGFVPVLVAYPDGLRLQGQLVDSQSGDSTLGFWLGCWFLIRRGQHVGKIELAISQLANMQEQAGDG